MGLFTNKAEKKIELLHAVLQRSFSNLKQDTNNINQWLNYLNQKSQHQEIIIQALQQQLSYFPKSKEEIKKIIDEYYSYEAILEKIEQLDKRVEELAKKHPSPQLEEIHNRLQKLEEKKPTIKEKIIKKITKNTKDYVKHILLSMIKKYEHITALQLKEIIVDEQGLCSKSSFYRLLEEIEKEEEIAVIREAKEKHYFYKIRKTT